MNDAQTLQASYLEWLDLSGNEAAREVFSSWRFYDLAEDGQVLGIAMMKGTEIHFAAAPEWRGEVITRRRAREFLAPLMDIYGFLTTRSLQGDRETAVFLQRLGFVLTWTELHIHHWMLTALPFGKGK